MGDLKYPIGPFEINVPPSSGERPELLESLERLPHCIRSAVAGLSKDQLDTPYRPEGWTVRQVVHHLADSRLTWYVRTKLALTEDSPVVNPYDEAAWASLEESLAGPIEPSLLLIESLHTRWAALLRSLTEQQWNREAAALHRFRDPIRFKRDLAQTPARLSTA